MLLKLPPKTGQYEHDPSPTWSGRCDAPFSLSNKEEIFELLYSGLHTNPLHSQGSKAEQSAPFTSAVCFSFSPLITSRPQLSSVKV